MSSISEREKPRRAAFAFIFVTVLLDMLSLGVVIPVLPKLVLAMTRNDMVHASEIYGAFGTVWGLMQFLSAPVIGALSDRFGRRPVVLASNAGLGLDYIVMALAPSLGWLLVGRIVSGITAASIPTAFAYIADVTEPEKRAARFGMLGAAFGAGFVLGPALGGWAGSIDLRLPFWIAAALSTANACYGLFVLPESLPPERRVPFAWKRANPLGAGRFLWSRRALRGLAAVNFLSFLAHAAMPSVLVLYTTYRYAWDERVVGLTMAGVGVCGIVVQGALVGPIVRRIGERATLLAGLACGVSGFVVYGLAETETLFWAGAPLIALWGLSGPALQGLMSRHSSAEEQGRLQGANGSIKSIAGLFGPGLFAFAFSYFIDASLGRTLPGAPMLLAAAILIMSCIIAFRATQRRACESE